MSAPLPPQSIPGFSTVDVVALLLAVASLLVATTFAILMFTHYNTYIRLLDEHNQAIWLSNILPIIEECDAAQGAQESPSTEFSISIARYVSFHFSNFLMLTRGGVSF